MLEINYARIPAPIGCLPTAKGRMVETEKPITGPLVVEEPEAERSVEATLPAVADLPKTYLQQGGYRLTWGALIGLFVVVLLFLAILVWGAPTRYLPEQEATLLLKECLSIEPAKKDACPPWKQDIAKVVVADPTTGDFREFWKGMFERIVGTTLLPIVTALLGYLFGSQTRQETAASPGKPPRNPAS